MIGPIAMSGSRETKQLLLVLPANLVSWLDVLAKDNSVSRTWLIKQVLYGYRDALESDAAAEAARPEPQIGLAAVRPRRSSPDNDVADHAS